MKAELDSLMSKFFEAVSFETGTMPAYEDIADLFIERGLLVKNVDMPPEISSVEEFIAPRKAQVLAGTLTRFHESELSEKTVSFGNVAHRFSAYTKSGTSNGVAFQASGMISTQFVNTPAGWKMSAMAWDDEKPQQE
jgi:hypothetical protein